MSKVCHGICLCLEINYDEFTVFLLGNPVFACGCYFEIYHTSKCCTSKHTAVASQSKAVPTTNSPTRKLHSNIYKTKDCRGI